MNIIMMTNYVMKNICALNAMTKKKKHYVAKYIKMHFLSFILANCKIHCICLHFNDVQHFPCASAVLLTQHSSPKN